jgi:two-component system chemotaxis response regulator CheB
MTAARKIKVLIVDDSAIVRKILSDSLAAEPDIEVVGAAPDPFIARDKILRFSPDVLTLDIEMPRMDGLTFLKKLMRARPLPVIVISSIAQNSSRAAIDALANGAVEVLAKPSGPYSVGEFRTSLADKIRAAASARPQRPERPATPAIEPSAAQPAPCWVAPPGATRLVAIGASTGGTEAIERILTQLPEQFAPVVITQHIPAGFSRAFAERLDRLCRIHVREASNGDIAAPGTALVAPGNYHMRVLRMGGRYRVAVEQGPPVCYQRPSVDVLFDSVAEQAGGGAVGALLTGMGADGARGLLRMREAGAMTIAQDEASCAVFGMPKEAIRTGAAREILPLDRIALRLVSLVCAQPETENCPRHCAGGN